MDINNSNNPYFEEARARWGNAAAFKQSRGRVKKMTPRDFARIKHDSEDLVKEIAGKMALGPKDPSVQSLIARHYEDLREFYDPNLDLYRGLAQMYVSDQRFSLYFDRFGVGLSQFMHDAMIAFCDKQEAK